MKKPIFKNLWTPIFCSILISVACNKADSFNSDVKKTEINNENKVRASGVAEDDPALVAKVPMIISSEFLKLSKDLPFSTLSARTRTPKGGSDNTAPSVSISSPSNSSTVSGTVNVQATASDNVGVSLVSLSVDGTVVSSSSTSPYSFPWNSATVSNGTHTLTVTAKDVAGNASSVSIQVNASNTSGGDIISPTISITSPASGSSVSGTVNIAAAASDNVGISSVLFSVDGAPIGSDNSAPYSFSWNSSTVANGIHTITAKATDAAGNVGSSSIQVTVNTTVLPPSSLPSSIQLSMPPVGHQGGEGSCVSFGVGYAVRSSEQFYKTGATSYSFANNIFSPEFLYNQTKVDVSCSSGAGILTTLEFMKSTGICTWQSMPYTSTDCSQMPNSSQLSEASNFKISSYSSIYTSDLTAIKTALANKHPLIVAFTLDNSFYGAGPGFIWKSYSNTGGPFHCVAICGYDDSKNAVKIMNSWGTTWGDAGYTWIDYNFLSVLTGKVYVMNL